MKDTDNLKEREAETMLHLMRYLRDGLSYLRNQRGAELVEWLLVVSLIAGVAVATYAALQGGLTSVVTDITTFMQGQTP